MEQASFDSDPVKDLETQRKHGVSFLRAQYAEARRSMTAKTRYRNEPLGDVRVVSDFLPTPAELAFREDGVKVTLSLSRKSIDFFKSEAEKHHTQYQRMIRRLLDAYVDVQVKNTRPAARAARSKMS